MKSTDSGTPPLEHASGCFWIGAYPPIDGDEAACCDCGAYEDAMVRALAALDQGEGGRP